MPPNRCTPEQWRADFEACGVPTFTWVLIDWDASACSNMGP